MPSPRTIRWGVYGVGAIAGRFASDLARLKDGRLAAVASRTATSARTFAKAYQTEALENLDALLKSDVDIVYVATPNDSHLEVALRSIEAGKAVLVEKPIATSSNDAALIAEAAKARNVFCMEAMWMRFTPGFRQAKALIDEGRIGTVRHLSADLHYPHAASAADPLSLIAGTPSSLDLGVYPVSLAISLFGAPSTVSGALIKSETGPDVQAAFSLGWSSKTASLSCGYLAEGGNSATIIGSRGVITLHRQFLSPPFLTIRRTGSAAAGSSQQVIIKQRPPRFPSLRRVFQPINPRSHQVRWTLAQGFGLVHQIKAVQDCLHRGELECALAPLQDSIVTLEALEALIH